MNNHDFKPEGLEQFVDLSPNILERAKENGRILQAKVKKCDSQYNLHIDLGCMSGIIPFEECALGVETGEVKPIAIITRVGRAVCFKVLGFQTVEGARVAILSRRLAQEDFCKQVLQPLQKGDIIPAKVTRLENFGAFVDVGCGIISLISIDNISVSRICHPKERFAVGQALSTIVTEPYAHGRISLSHKELLGTWLENSALFTPGQIVTGIVRSVEDYGIFIELTPNLAGLAEPQEGLSMGETAIVYIKSIIPEKMKIKLSIADHFFEKTCLPLTYFVKDGHLDLWRYSPPSCPRVTETVF